MGIGDENGREREREREREKCCGWAVAFYLTSDRVKEATWADGLSTLLINVNQEGKDDEDERDRRRGEKITDRDV